MFTIMYNHQKLTMFSSMSLLHLKSEYKERQPHSEMLLILRTAPLKSFFFFPEQKM